MGINSNNSKISQVSTENQYPYYEDEQVAQVYYNGTLVWKKYVPLDFTFSNNTVTGYKGSATSITIPSSYTLITDIDGTIIYAEGTDTTVTAIGDDAFAENTTLKEVTIPSSVTTIGQRAFQKCYNLTTVNMSATPNTIDYCAFALTNLTEPTEYMYNCPSLGQGALAFRNTWTLTTTDETVANNLIQASLGTLADGDYTGYGKVFALACIGIASRQGSGNNSVSGTITAVHVKINGVTYTTSGSWSVKATHTWTDITYVIIAQDAVPGVSASKNSSVSNYSSDTCYCNTAAATYSNNVTATAGSLIKFYVNCNFVGTCLVKGTLITLADGTQKPVEDITYKDLLLVWNFETGSYDYQYPLAIIKGGIEITRYKIILEDNSYLEICGRHDIYDPIANIFRVYGEGAINIVDKDYYILKYIDNKTYACYKIKTIETLPEESQAYSIITGGTITAFANNILIGMDTLNRSRIGSKNSFEKEFQKDKELCYTYDKVKKEIYSEASKYLILGLNLHYVDYYNKEREGLSQLLAPFNCMISPTIINNKYKCMIGILDGDCLIESEHLEDEEITLPKITSELKTHWYIVGEYKLLKPGDKLKINFSTLIRAV